MNETNSAQTSGYVEHEHTADWELEVFAPDLPGLLEQAARGMYELAGMRLEEERSVEKDFEITILDDESMIVDFLSELLYLAEQEELGFTEFSLQLTQDKLSVKLTGAPILSMNKEIKAVTYHNLDVRHSERGVQANIVFDV